MPQRNKQHQKSADAKKTFSIILSIAVALVLWAYVLGEVNPTTQQTIPNVPVQLLNVQSLTARELAISGDAEYTVDVVVEGKRADIINITAAEINAEADLFGWSKGENYIPVNVSVPQPLKVIEVKPAKIQVTIEDLVALSKPVVVIYRGDMPDNTEAGAVAIKPSGIEVSGARSEVESVTQIQVLVDTTDLSEDGQTVQSSAIPVNYAGMPVENVKLSANYVEVFARLFQIKDVALNVEVTGDIGEGYGAELNIPETIRIKGSRQVLENITAVDAEPVDVSNITGDGTVTLKVILPEGTELAKGYERITAGVTIRETGSKVFNYTADQILLEGLTKGKTVNTETESIEVAVTGRKEIVEQMTEDQLELYIDVEGLEEGVQTVQVMVFTDIQLHTITVNPQEIEITLVETETEQENE